MSTVTAHEQASQIVIGNLKSKSWAVGVALTLLGAAGGVVYALFAKSPLGFAVLAGAILGFILAILAILWMGRNTAEKISALEDQLVAQLRSGDLTTRYPGLAAAPPAVARKTTTRRGEEIVYARGSGRASSVPTKGRYTKAKTG